MTRKPYAQCQGCERPMWAKAGSPAPRFCRSCRADGSRRAVRGLGLTRTEAAARARAAKEATVRTAVCVSCPVEFTTTAPNRRYCDECAAGRISDRHRKKNRSRLGYQKAIRAFPLNMLGERDAWTCWLCLQPVDKALKSRHPLMASYDHVVPTSQGGSDEQENLRLAHLRCNIARGNR